MSARILFNPLRSRPGAVARASPDRAVLDFHRRLPGYAPTPMVDAAGLVRYLGVGKLWVKDESSRLGLPSFKILGASWATYSALTERLGGGLRSWSTLTDLSAQLEPLRPLTLVAATDG